MALFLDPVVRRYLGGPIAPERATAIAEALPYDSADRGSRAIRLNDDDRLVGLISLSAHHDGSDIEISYMLDPQIWGRGVATAVLRGVIARCGDDLGLDRLVAETQEANAASRRVLEKVGMRPIKTLERFGAPQVIYSIQTK